MICFKCDKQGHKEENYPLKVTTSEACEELGELEQIHPEETKQPEELVTYIEVG